MIVEGDRYMLKISMLLEKISDLLWMKIPMRNFEEPIVWIFSKVISDRRTIQLISAYDLNQS